MEAQRRRCSFAGRLTSRGVTAEPVSLAGPHPVLLGAYSALLHVPADAEYTEHTISLICSLDEDHKSWQFVASQVVAVSDPRPPTVSLKASVGDKGFLQPGGTVKLLVETSTMSGVKVADASITLRWSVARVQAGRREERRGWDNSFSKRGASEAAHGEHGEEQLLTDRDGAASVEWRPQLASAELPGDVITVTLEWIGPTRERVTKSLTVVVAISEVGAPPRS